jgi:hypothetical protein
MCGVLYDPLAVLVGGIKSYLYGQHWLIAVTLRPGPVKRR